MKRALAALFLIATSLWLMTGCAGVRLVDTDVTAFPKWTAAPPGPGTAYRFERLPSQQSQPAQQDAVEADARTALARVGLELNPPVARYSVQIVATTQIIERGYPGYDGIFGGPGVFLGGGNRGAGFGLSFPMRFPEPTYFKRELAILMRELSTQQVVFEARAFHDGVWSDSQAVFPAMMDAALRGFPEPPPGTRRINVEIPR
jgi:Domain of unknown function (DUF4136)